MIIDNFGDILTSLHVVANANRYPLHLCRWHKNPGATWHRLNRKKILLFCRQRLCRNFLSRQRLGNAGALQVGDEAYVVGNPFGLYSSMSAGVISGFDRTFQPAGYQADQSRD